MVARRDATLVSRPSKRLDDFNLVDLIQTLVVKVLGHLHDRTEGEMNSPIVGIGASAGGLEAVSEILEALPSRPGVAIIVVQHLDRTRDSMLSEILRRRTKLPVIEAQDGMPVAADHVYVIP